MGTIASFSVINVSTRSSLGGAVVGSNSAVGAIPMRLGKGCSMTPHEVVGLRTGWANKTAPLVKKTRVIHKQHNAATKMMVRMMGMGDDFGFNA